MYNNTYTSIPYSSYNYDNSYQLRQYPRPGMRPPGPPRPPINRPFGNNFFLPFTLGVLTSPLLPRPYYYPNYYRPPFYPYY